MFKDAKRVSEINLFIDQKHNIQWRQLMELAGRVVAAICHAGWMPASTDVLPGRNVTSFLATKDDMVHAGADFIDQEVVVDGNIITGRKPDDLPAFMKAIIAALG